MSKARRSAANASVPRASLTAALDGTMPQPARLDRLRRQLVPFTLHYFRKLDSSSDTAGDMLAAGRMTVPAVVVAGRQAAGRGQRGRTWFSGRRSVAATFVFPESALRPPHQLALVAGLAMRDALAELVGEIGLQVKWPNDVLLRGRKVAGLLCERKLGADLVGVGINLIHRAGELPHELRSAAIALADVVAPPSRLDVLAAAAARLNDRLLLESPAAAWAATLAAWPEHDTLRDRVVEAATTGGVIRGRASGIDAHGRLCLRLPSGDIRTITSATVRLVE